MVEMSAMDKKPYSSLKRKTPLRAKTSLRYSTKSKKDVAPWRKGILDHHQHRPTKADRAEFPKDVLERLIQRAGGKCEVCRQKKDMETHHIQPRNRGGRGVYENGLRVCFDCHQKIQNDETELQRWITWAREKYGEYFWYDELDWEEHNRKLETQRKEEEERQKRLEQIRPIVNLVSKAAGRELYANEIRLIDRLGELDKAVFTKMMQDIISKAKIG